MSRPDHSSLGSRVAGLVAGVAACLVIAVQSAAAAPAPPLQTYSYYMSTVDQSTLYNLGYSIGEATAGHTFPQHALFVLDWGAGYCNSTTCGTYLPGGCGCFEGTAAERAASEQFGEGYYYGTGSDTSAVAFVAMGTSNYGGWFADSSNASRFGSWWASTVNKEEAWFKTNGYGSQTDGRGAIDAELAWNGPDPTLTWSHSYDSSGSYYYYDFGDAAGCPQCQNSWSERNVYYMAYGDSLAEPLPEIYNNAMATEWGDIADYAYNDLGAGMTFLGSMSQYQACQDLGVPCTGADNTAAEAWTDLYDALNCSSGCPDPQTPSASTDIRWKLES